jgi:flagellar motor switch protein FliN
MATQEIVQQAGPATVPAEAPKAAGTATATVNGIDFILDIPMQVSVQLGSTRMLIRELLQLGQGSVIELEKLAGEPMEVLVNNKLVARGEVVVVNEKFGIRLTDVVSATERIQQLT